MDNNTEVAVQSPKKGKTIIIMAVVIGFLALLLIGGYFLFNKTKTETPKEVFASANKYLKESFLEEVDKNVKTVRGDFSFKTGSILGMVDPISISANYGIDYEKKIANIDFDAEYANKKLIAFNTYLDNSKVYILLKDIYSKYISSDLPTEEYNLFFQQQKLEEDYRIVIEETFNIIDQALLDEYFTASKDKITLNGKEVSVTKNTLTLNNKNSNEIFNTLLTELKNNSKFINIITTINEITKEELLEILNETTFEDLDLDMIGSISIYTKNGSHSDFAGIEYVINVDKELVKFIILDEGNSKYSFEVRTIVDQVETKLTGGTIIINKKDGRTTVEVTITVDFVTINFTISHKEEINKEITSKTITDVVKYEELTEKDIEIIMAKLMENEGVKSLLELFSGFEEM